MKKMLLKFALALAFIGAIITFSCEEPKPDCEIYDYGTVIVKNETGFKAEVDVTWGSYDTNDERIVYNGSSTTYREVPAGKIYMWVSIYTSGGWSGWLTPETEYLSSCYELTYRWYNSNAKSTNSLSLDIIRDGVVIKTITEFESEKKK